MTDQARGAGYTKGPDDGGPAFPTPFLATEAGRAAAQALGGMSLRDWFAGQALAGEMASYAGSCADPANHADEIAARCLKIADAMLAARAKGEA